MFAYLMCAERKYCSQDAESVNKIVVFLIHNKNEFSYLHQLHNNSS